MVAVNLSFIGGAGWQFFDNDGVPLAGGKIYTYAAGTTTPLTTYTSRSGTVPNANPIILDAAGRTPQQIWSTEGLLYKYTVTDANDVLIRTWDNIGGSIVASDLAQNLASTTDNADGDAMIGFRQSGPSGFAVGAVGSTVNNKLQEIISVKDFGAVGDGIADDTPAINAAIAHIKTLNGGVVYLPQGDYKITSTIWIDADNVFLQGAGSGGNKNGIASIRNSAATRLVWAGNTTTPMVLFETPDGSVSKQSGGLSYLMLDAQNLARYGLRVTSWTGALFEYLVVYGATETLIRLDTKKAGTLAAAPYDCIRNIFRYVFTTCRNLADNTAQALMLGAGPDGGDRNSCFNYFEHCNFNAGTLSANGASVVLENTDNNVFFHCTTSRLHFQSGDQDASGGGGVSRYNWVIACEIGTIVAVASTTGGASSFGNTVIATNNSNNAGNIFVGSGAQLNASDMFGFLTKQKLERGFVVGNLDPATETQLAVISGNDLNETGATWLRPNVVSAPAPYLRITGVRNDANTGTQFSGRLALDSYRSDAPVASGKALGTIQFGGSSVANSSARANVFYSAGIVGRAAGTISSASSCPVNLEFAANSTGAVMGSFSPTVRMRVKYTGAVQFVPLAADPSPAEEGDVYYNSVTKKLRFYNGTAWADV